VLVVMRLFALTLVLLAAPALACWDGFHAVVGNADARGPSNEWAPHLIKANAQRLGRLNALLPVHAQLIAVGDRMSVVLDGGVEYSLVGERDELGALARVLRAPKTALRRARSLETPAFVVQAGAFRTRAAAEKVALEVDDVRHEHPSAFFQVGGFPGLNASAHVSSDGERHRVFVGAFLDLKVAQTLARRIGRGAFVRRL
jgi:hypothetical protein